MDEIEWMKIIKKAIKFISITVLLVSFFIGIIASFSNDFEKEEIILSIVLMICIGIVIIIINLLTYGIMYVIYRFFYMKPDIINLNKQYIRDLDNYYPPAIVSLLHNFNIEIYRDYTATILNLYLKKYIDVSSFSDNIQFYQTEKNDFSKLQNHEIYVYNCILNKEPFDEEKFKQNIYEDAEKNGLVKKKYLQSIQEKITKITIIMLVIIYGLLLIYGTRWKSEVCYIMLWVMIIPILGYRKEIYNFFKKQIKNIMSKYKLQAKGKKEKKKIEAFRNYINEYTLIKEKEIDYIQILERYIPYSLSLGMSPQIEKYIKENEIYRNLIYRERK